jgi:rubrerythrin
MKDYIAKIMRSKDYAEFKIKEIDYRLKQIEYRSIVNYTFLNVAHEAESYELDPVKQEQTFSISGKDIRNTILSFKKEDLNYLKIEDREDIEDWLFFILKKTNFAHTSAYFKQPIHVWGEHVSLINFFVCPHCGTIIETHDDDSNCLHPFMCPTCWEKEGGEFKEGFWWKYWTTEHKDYQDVKKELNSHISWDKKYYFHIGMKDYGQPFHIGKWYPKIPKYYKYNDKKWSMGTFYLGFYPYQVWCSIKRSPHSLKFWFEKNFQKEKYEARMNKLFPDRATH